MPGNPHPVVAPYTDRSASEIIAYEKLHSRVVVADAPEVRNTDFSIQFGGLYIRDLSANFNLDTSSTDADDGLNFVIDSAGNHFVRVVNSVSPVIATYGDADISGGAVTVADEVDIALINTTAPVNVNVPAQADRVGRGLLIKDAGGVGFTPVLAGVETIDGAAASGFAVSTPKGWLDLGPVTGGYFVKSAQF